MKRKIKKFANKVGGKTNLFSGDPVLSEMAKKMRKDKAEVTGENMRKEAEMEQAKQRETIGKQRQQEQLKLAEMDSEINRRRLIRYNGGMRTLYSTLGG
jgi:hypothetical protein